MAYAEMDVTESQTRLLEAPASLTLIDVCTPAEVARGGIVGAQHIPLHLLPTRLHELDTDKPMVFYCHRGNHSAIADAFTAARGRNNVFNLRGGVLGWLQCSQSLFQVIH